MTPPDNGFMKCDSDGNNYGATCEFKCTGGYELQGSAARVCQYGLTWSGTETNCTGTCLCTHMHTHHTNVHDTSTMLCLAVVKRWSGVLRGSLEVKMGMSPSARVGCQSITEIQKINTACSEIDQHCL